MSNSPDISWCFWRWKDSKRCEHTNIASIRVCSDGRKMVAGAARGTGSLALKGGVMGPCSIL